MCKGQGRIVTATVCDHVTPHKGDPDLFWSGPFQSLCTECHNRTKQRIELRGHHDEVDASGWPTDPRHRANRAGAR
jgi:5-methylcytosine-specific restriction enzyme A